MFLFLKAGHGGSKGEYSDVTCCEGNRFEALGTTLVVPWAVLGKLQASYCKRFAVCALAQPSARKEATERGAKELTGG